MRYVLLVLAIIVSPPSLPALIPPSLVLPPVSHLFNNNCPLQISLHFILSFSHEEYGRATSLSRFGEQFQGTGQADGTRLSSSPAKGTPRRANATFVLLARNSDLEGVATSMKQMGASSQYQPVATLADLRH